MANEFVARNGLIAQNNSTVTGSLNVTGGITGSLLGTASYADEATSSSYATTASHALSAPPGGLDTQIQFNSGSVFGGSTDLVYNYISSSLAHGQSPTATGQYSHAEGGGTQAIGQYSHAEGGSTQAIGNYSHAEGGGLTQAIGEASHAEGRSTQAIGPFSHAEGQNTQAVGDFSHTEGFNTITSGSHQLAVGQYNIPITDQSAFIIGDGTAGIGNEHNLLVAASGAVTISGSLLVDGSTTSTSFTGSLQGTASYADQALSSSFASTASYAPAYLPLTGGTINGNVTVNGTASIAFLNVTYESASIIYSSGSNQLGDATNDIQTLIGRTIVSGSLEVTGSFKVNDGTNLNIDSSNRVLYRSTGTGSINWGNGSLIDINGNVSLNWSQYLTQDANRSSSINWDTRKLFYTDGLTYVVDWASLDLFDVSQISSINWGSRNLNDIAGLQSIDWGNRAQYDSLGNPSIYWDGRTQYDSFSVPSIDWENRQLLDSTGTLILDWSGSLGLLTGSVYGTSSWAENSISASRADSIPLAGIGNGEIQVNNGGAIGASNRIYINLATSTLHTANGGTLSATGSLLGTSSYADQALSSSYVLTASFALNGGGGPSPAANLFNYYNFI